jgi:hypothetical protein
MKYFSPERIPVLTKLATEYAVFIRHDPLTAPEGSVPGSLHQIHQEVEHFNLFRILFVKALRTVPAIKAGPRTAAA